MLNLSIVTTAEPCNDTATGDEEDLQHGTNVVKKLEVPWAGTKRVVCAEPSFASGKQMLSMFVRFIGVVKTATKGYPMGTSSVLSLEERGEHIAYAYKTADGASDMIAVLWVDRERLYFISQTSCTLTGSPSDL